MFASSSVAQALAVAVNSERSSNSDAMSDKAREKTWLHPHCLADGYVPRCLVTFSASFHNCAISHVELRKVAGYRAQALILFHERGLLPVDRWEQRMLILRLL
jgi:hypothetical protein